MHGSQNYTFPSIYFHIFESLMNTLWVTEMKFLSGLTNMEPHILIDLIMGKNYSHGDKRNSTFE